VLKPEEQGTSVELLVWGFILFHDNQQNNW
jgi:hypothetical protein